MPPSRAPETAPAPAAPETPAQQTATPETPAPAGTEVHPVSRLDVWLWRGRNRLGLLARLRDLLPGRIAFGLTGRGPDGTVLPHGAYRIELVAAPTGDGPTTTRTIGFRIK